MHAGGLELDVSPGLSTVINKYWREGVVMPESRSHSGALQGPYQRWRGEERKQVRLKNAIASQHWETTYL